jgi:hypothetical protein
MENAEYLIEKIQEEINDKKKFERLDFIKSQWLTWGAISIGFGAAVANSFECVTKGQVAIFGCISALFVSIEKSVNFSKRSSWNGYYKVQLESLLLKLKANPGNLLKLNDEFTNLRIEWLKTFPGSTTVHGK